MFNMIIIIIILYMSALETSLSLVPFDENLIEENSVGGIQSCICVPYWQCKDDFSGLVEDGVDIIDIRVFKNPNSDLGCTGDFDICCQVECGRAGEKPSLDYQGFDESYDSIASRILGNHNEAEYGEFPWMLGVLLNKVYKCGATLVHPQVAITAAHCVPGAEKYKIRAGEWNWESKHEPMIHQDRMTAKIIIHPQYHPASLRNDIAILILESPFKLAENVGVVCLPPLGTNYDGERCVVSGWGKNSIKKNTYQSILKKIDLPVMPRSHCVNVLREARLGVYFNLHKSFMCAGGEQNRDTCKGDGGSPLVCPIVGQPGRFEQVGIVSWGLSCGVQNTPGVYVNVALFTDWIDKQMLRHNFDSNVYRS